MERSTMEIAREWLRVLDIAPNLKMPEGEFKATLQALLEAEEVIKFYATGHQLDVDEGEKARAFLAKHSGRGEK